MKLKHLTVLAALVLALAACGGDSDDSGSSTGGATYTGNTNPATVDSSNAQDISITAKDSVLQGISQDSADSLPQGISADMNQTIEQLAQLAIDKIQSLPNIPTASTFTANCNDPDFGDPSGSGSFTFSGNSDGTEVTVTYNNCSLDGVYFANGSITIISSADPNTYDFTIIYNNLELTGPYGTETLSGSFTCNLSGCSYDYTVNGRTYRTSGTILITGDNTIGYDVSVTVYDPDHGYVSIQAENIKVCDDGSLGYGDIYVYDSTSSSQNVMQISFPGMCPASTMAVTIIGGSTETYNQ